MMKTNAPSSGTTTLTTVTTSSSSSTSLRSRKPKSTDATGGAQHPSAGALPLHGASSNSRRRKLTYSRPNGWFRRGSTKIASAAVALVVVSVLAVAVLSRRVSTSSSSSSSWSSSAALSANAPLPPSYRKRLLPDLSGDVVYDVAVAGAGPAGLSAALFASRAGLRVIVLGSEAGALRGTERLDNFPSFVAEGGGPAWLDATKRQALSFGARFAPPGLLVRRVGRVSKLDTDASRSFRLRDMLADNAPWRLDVEDGSVVRARALIAATGATPRRLNLEGEDDLWGVAVHSCALCDGHLYRRRRVLVVGGGDAAVDAALLLARHAAKVLLVHRRDAFDRARDQASLRTLRATANVEMITPYEVTEWRTAGEGGDVRLTGAVVRHATNDAVAPRTLEVDGAFTMIGAEPNTAWLREDAKQQQRTDKDAPEPIAPDLDETTGLIKLAQPGVSTATSVEGIFAAGEVVDGVYKQAVTAAAEGARAAVDAERWLRETRGVEPGGWDDEEDNEEEDGATTTTTTTALPPVDVDCDLTDSSCVERVVRSRPVVLFVKEGCPYCTKALEALQAAGANDPLVIDVNKRTQSAANIQDNLQKMTGRRTVPNVFVGGETIGGGDETAELQRRDGLRPLVEKAVRQVRTVEEPQPPLFTSESLVDCDLADPACLRRVVEDHPVVVVVNSTAPSYPFAVAAVLMIGALDAVVVDASKRSDADAVWDVLSAYPGAPRDSYVFVGGAAVGDGDAAFREQRRGRLRAKAEEAGARLEPDIDERGPEWSPCRRPDLMACVENMVRTVPVLLFTVSWCPMCVQMREFLDGKKIQYRTFDLEKDCDNDPGVTEALRQNILDVAGSGYNAMPHLFVGGVSFRGPGYTKNQYRQGNLRAKLKELGQDVR